jgi:hypothetical protein
VNQFTHMKPVGFETISLLIRLPFLAGVGKGNALEGGGAGLFEITGLGPGVVSSYRGPARRGSGSWVGGGPQPSKREGDGVGIIAKRSKKPLCRRVPPGRVVEGGSSYVSG